MSQTLNGQRVNELHEWDYIFKENKAGTKYMITDGGKRQSLDDLDTLADLLVDNNSQLTALIQGNWNLSKQLYFEGDPAGAGTFQPVIEAKSAYHTKVSMTGDDYLVYITKGIAPILRGINWEMRKVTSCKPAIYGEELAGGDPTPVGYEETSFYNGILEGCRFSGGVNQGDNLTYCVVLRNGEMYQMYSNQFFPSGANIGGINLKNIDMTGVTPPWSLNDAYGGGKTKIGLTGSANPIGILIDTAGGVEPNLLNLEGTYWIRHLSANGSGRGTGVKLNGAANMKLGNFHYENLELGFDIDDATDVEIFSWNKYNFVVSGGKHYDIEAAASGLEIHAKANVTAGVTFIDNAGGDFEYPNKFWLKVQGTAAPIMVWGGKYNIMTADGGTDIRKGALLN